MIFSHQWCRKYCGNWIKCWLVACSTFSRTFSNVKCNRAIKNQRFHGKRLTMQMMLSNFMPLQNQSTCLRKRNFANVKNAENTGNLHLKFLCHHIERLGAYCFTVVHPSLCASDSLHKLENLTFSHYSYTSLVTRLILHFRKRRGCLLRAIIPFPTVFSKVLVLQMKSKTSPGFKAYTGFFFRVRGRHPMPVKRPYLGEIFYECCFTSFNICVTHIIPYYTISCIDILCPCTK